MFCERIFGPVKDINPHDAKYKGVRSREAAVDKNGELVTRSIVRRERMGHISLAVPVAHIWFLRGTPSAMGLLLGMTVKNLERVAYFASYIIKKLTPTSATNCWPTKKPNLPPPKKPSSCATKKKPRPKTPTSKPWPKCRPKKLEELTKEFEAYKRPA